MYYRLIQHTKACTATLKNQHNGTLKNFEQLKGIIKTNIPVQDVVALSKQQSGAFSNLADEDFESVINLYNLLHQQGKAITYGGLQQSATGSISRIFY